MSIDASSDDLDALRDLEMAVATEDAERDKTAPSTEAEKKKRRTNRGSLPAHLPRVHITLTPDSTACPCCHSAMHVIGEDTAERLDKIPAQYQVIVTHRPNTAVGPVRARSCRHRRRSVLSRAAFPPKTSSLT